MAEAPPFDHRDVIEQYLEGYNSQDREALPETVSEEIVVHGLPGVEGDVIGLKEYGEWAAEMMTGLPDAHLELHDSFKTEDKGAARWTLSATHENDMFDMPATGEPFDVTGPAVFRMEDGKIAEKWYQQDGLGMLRQVGLVD